MTFRDVFAVREFQALFAAHVLSVIGDQFARLALAILVFERTGPAGLAALTFALTFLPDLVGSPLLHHPDGRRVKIKRKDFPRVA